MRANFQSFIWLLYFPAAKARRRRSVAAPLLGSDDQLQQQQDIQTEIDEKRQKRGTDQDLIELVRMSSQSGKTLEADQVFVSHV